MPMIKVLAMRKRESQGRPEWAPIQTRAQAQADQLMSSWSCVQIASCAWAGLLAWLLLRSCRFFLLLYTEMQKAQAPQVCMVTGSPIAQLSRRIGFDRELL